MGDHRVLGRYSIGGGIYYTEFRRYKRLEGVCSFKRGRLQACRFKTRMMTERGSQMGRVHDGISMVDLDNVLV